jgi:hypothetical protein
MWEASVKDMQGEVLCVSQFTLMANTSDLKPNFNHAMVRISLSPASVGCLSPIASLSSANRWEIWGHDER